MKIKFIDTMLDGTRTQRGVLAKTPQLQKDVQRYRRAREDLSKAVQILSSGNSLGNIEGIPIGLQTSYE